MDKRVRYVTLLFTLDKSNDCIGQFVWDVDNFDDFFKENEKRYGLKLVSNDKQVSIVVEYTNIIWDFKVYFTAYRKRYKVLSSKDDDRWKKLENYLSNNLKLIGLENLIDEIIECLQNGKHFEYKNKIDKQFKRYCV